MVNGGPENGGPEEAVGAEVKADQEAAKEKGQKEAKEKIGGEVVNKDASQRAEKAKQDAEAKLLEQRLKIFRERFGISEDLVTSLRLAAASLPSCPHGSGAFRALHQQLRGIHSMTTAGLNVPNDEADIADFRDTWYGQLVKALPGYPKLLEQFQKQREALIQSQFQNALDLTDHTTENKEDAEAREETIKAFLDAVPDFNPDLIPALREALVPMPRIDSGAPDEGRKLRTSLVETHMLVRRIAYLPPEGDKQRTEAFRKNVVEPLTKALPSFREEHQRFRKLQETHPADVATTSFTLERFRELMAILNMPEPLPPNAANNPDRGRYLVLPRESREWLRKEFTEVYGELGVLQEIRNRLRQIRRNIENGEEIIWQDERGNPISAEQGAVRLRDNFIAFLQRHQRYESALGAGSSHSVTGAQRLFDMVGMLIMRQPLDHVLPSFPGDPAIPTFDRPTPAQLRAGVRELTVAENLRLHEMHARIQKNLRTNGYTVAEAQRFNLSIEELTQLMHGGHPLANFARDCVRFNAFDGLLFVMFVHSSANKTKAVMDWFAMNGVNATVNAAGWSTQRFLLQMAQRSPGSARLALRLMRMVRHPAAVMVIATAVMYLGHDRLEAGTKFLDEHLPDFIRNPIGVVGALAAAPGSLFESGTDAMGLTLVDPEMDVMRYLSRQRVSARTVIDVATAPVLLPISASSTVRNSQPESMFNGIGDWNTRVDQAMKQEPNPIIRRLMELEKIDGEGRSSRWAKRQSVDVVRRMSVLVPREREINMRLSAMRKRGIVVPNDINGVELATTDDNANARRNDLDLGAALRSGGSLWAVKQLIEQVERRPTNTGDKKRDEENRKYNEQHAEQIELRELWNAYIRDLTELAGHVAVYRNLNIYNRATWIGQDWREIGLESGRYRMTAFTQEGMVLEIAHNMARREATTFNLESGLYGDITTKEQFAKKLSHATVRGQDILDRRNPLRHLDALAACSQLFTNLSEMWNKGLFAQTTTDMREWDNKRLMQVRNMLTRLTEQAAKRLPDLSPESLERFGKITEPVRKIVLQYRGGGNPTPSQLEQVASSVAEALVLLEQEHHLQLWMPSASLHSNLFWPRSQNEFPWRGAGEWGDDGRKFVTEQFRNVIPRDFPTHYAVIHCTPPPAYPTASLYAFNFNGPNRQDWRVFVCRKRQVIGSSGPPRVETLAQTDVSFEEWMKSNGPIAQSMEPVFKTRQLLQERTKVWQEKEEKEHQENRKKEAIRAEELLTRSREIAGSTPGVFTEVSVSPEQRSYMTAYGDATVLYTFDRRGNPYLRRDPRAGPELWGPGGPSAPSPTTFNTDRRSPSEHDGVTFQIIPRDGSPPRRISIGSFEQYQNRPQSERQLFDALMTTPTNDRVALSRMICFFDHQFHDSGYFSFNTRDRYVARDRLFGELLQMYLLARGYDGKRNFLRELWAQLVTHEVVNGATTDAIVAHFRSEEVRKRLGIEANLYETRLMYAAGNVTVGGQNVLEVFWRENGRTLSRGEIDRYADSLWERDNVLLSLPSPTAIEVSLPEVALSSDGASVYGQFSALASGSAKQREALEQRRNTLAQEQKQLGQILTSGQPPTAEQGHRIQTYLSNTADYRRQCAVFRTGQLNLRIVARAVEPHLRDFQFPAIDRSLVLSTIPYNAELQQEYAKLQWRGALLRGRPIAQQIMDAVTRSFLDARRPGTTVAAELFTAFRSEVEAYAKDLTAFERRVREAREPTLAARKAIAAPADRQFAALPQDAGQSILASGERLPPVLMQGSLTSQDRQVLRRALERLRESPPDRLAFDQLHSIFIESSGSAANRAYLITCVYNRREAGQSLPAVHIGAQYRQPEDGTTPTVQLGTLELVERGTTSVQNTMRVPMTMLNFSWNSSNDMTAQEAEVLRKNLSPAIAAIMDAVRQLPDGRSLPQAVTELARKEIIGGRWESVAKRFQGNGDLSRVLSFLAPEERRRLVVDLNMNVSIASAPNVRFVLENGAITTQSIAVIVSGLVNESQALLKSCADAGDAEAWRQFGTLFRGGESEGALYWRISSLPPDPRANLARRLTELLPAASRHVMVPEPMTGGLVLRNIDDMLASVEKGIGDAAAANGLAPSKEQADKLNVARLHEQRQRAFVVAVLARGTLRVIESRSDADMIACGFSRNENPNRMDYYFDRSNGTIMNAATRRPVAAGDQYFGNAMHNPQSVLEAHPAQIAAAEKIIKTITALRADTAANAKRFQSVLKETTEVHAKGLEAIRGLVDNALSDCNANIAELPLEERQALIKTLNARYPRLRFLLPPRDPHRMIVFMAEDLEREARVSPEREKLQKNIQSALQKEFEAQAKKISPRAFPSPAYYPYSHGYGQAIRVYENAQKELVSGQIPAWTKRYPGHTFELRNGQIVVSQAEASTRLRGRFDQAAASVRAGQWRAVAERFRNGGDLEYALLALSENECKVVVEQLNNAMPAAEAARFVWDATEQTIVVR